MYTLLYEITSYTYLFGPSKSSQSFPSLSRPIISIFCLVLLNSRMFKTLYSLQQKAISGLELKIKLNFDGIHQKRDG